MKKLLSVFVLSTMMLSQANAGILILTGDIGNKFNGYKTVGWLTIILTGATVVGLVVDENEAVEGSFDLDNLSEASKDLIMGAPSVKNALADSDNEEIVTISEDLASDVLWMEGLEGTVAGERLFTRLTQ
jgi:hypothetical protein